MRGGEKKCLQVFLANTEILVGVPALQKGSFVF